MKNEGLSEEACGSGAISEGGEAVENTWAKPICSISGK